MEQKKLGKKAAAVENTPPPAGESSELVALALKDQLTLMTELHNEVVAEITSALGSIRELVDRVDNDVKAARQEAADSHRLLANAMLYLLNTAVQDDGDEYSDISRIPSPEDYLEEVDN